MFLFYVNVELPVPSIPPFNSLALSLFCDSSVRILGCCCGECETDIRHMVLASFGSDRHVLDRGTGVAPLCLHVCILGYLGKEGR